ncbi:thyrotroph embryonic factor isoform X1 [Hylaeus anthracinus]|uniref:thyrotroph embryonic factor isoform X1 n=1 Tax=Hylaeus anthracinus TaxID=313031 RepID=UPI0023B88603|nr:thyrotroph embryonic factor isoform X1 [Hylaeus anthracinus]
MSCAMEYQQLAPPPVPVTLHPAHHQQQHQQPVQPPHPHIVVAPALQQQPQQPPPPPLPPTSHGHQVHAPLPPIHDDSTSSRWSQYQHLWRQHHVYVNGRHFSARRTLRIGEGIATLLEKRRVSANGKQAKDGPEEKKDADGELWGNVEAQAAFLGPNLWDKTLPYDADLKVLNHYVDLDEFLSENGIPVDGAAGGGQGTMQSGQLHKINNTEAAGHQGPAGLHLEPVTKRERSPSPSECCSPDTMNPPSPADSTLSMASSGRDFDPRTRAFSDEELKPQPMIKKSRKQFVPDDLKDDKYWARRRKNNMAAKRSRDARRMKENQIALRAGFLEKENMGLRQELDRLKNENMLLRDELSKYTDV